MKQFSLLFLLLAAGCGRTPSDSRQQNSDRGLGDMLSQVNKVRSDGTYCGSDYYPSVGPLSWEDRLDSAAKVHGDDMVQQGYFDHTAPDGSSVGERVTRQSYGWGTVGENIAQGQSSVNSVMAAWIESAGHCRNLMNSRFTEMGAYRSGNTWVQVFARPQ